MIELTKEDSGLWIVTINRPDKANSLTTGMWVERARSWSARKTPAR